LTTEIQLAGTVYTDGRIDTRQLSKRHSLLNLRALATWIRSIDAYTPTLRSIADKALKAWCTRPRDELVIELELQIVQRTMSHSQEIETKISTGMCARGLCVKKVAGRRWILSATRSGATGRGKIILWS
jgi:hypothetical protein